MPGLELEHISKTFDDQGGASVRALDHVSVSVAPGEVLVILGTNGSGKTTLLNIAAGSLAPDTGRVRVGGTDLTHVHEHRRAKHFGRLSQDPTLGTGPSYTVRENLLLAQRKCRRLSPVRRLRQPTIEREIESFISEVAQELQARMEVPAGLLSGGERQLLALACMLLSAPEILLLDEHTASLDPRNATLVLDRTRAYVETRERCALMVTHNVSVAFKYGSRVVLLHEGRIEKAFVPSEQRQSEVTAMFYELHEGMAAKC